MSKNEIERGRLKDPIAKEVQKIMIEPTLSEEEIKRSYQIYLDINKAHVLMLAKTGIIKERTASKILNATQEMASMGDTPSFEITPVLEEMYFNLENHLIQMIGMEAGGQQHTARSRNDLHATVDRMEAREALLALLANTNTLRRTLLALARNHLTAVTSGYTHLQPSEPITFAHYLSAVLSALERDFARLASSWKSLNRNPLGGGSMGSTTWPIDREYTSQLLGFDGIVENSLDCVCSRDYLLEIMNGSAILASTLARLATDMRIWATPEYGYIEVADSVAVCSSIMPQKKNPWTFESCASFAARVKAASDAAWMTYKGVPYAFTMESMDLIANFWPCMKDINGMLTLMNVSMPGITFHGEQALEHAQRNFCTVTELANTLVRNCGISFREAHEVVAHAVGILTQTGRFATDLDSAMIAALAKDLLDKDISISDEELKRALDPEQNAKSKVAHGGTAPEEVTRQLDGIEKELSRDETLVKEKKQQLASSRDELETCVASHLAQFPVEQPTD